MAKEVPVHVILDKFEEVQYTYTHLLKQLQKETGLSSSAVPIIEIIQDDKLTLKEITEYSSLDKSTISRQVKQLVKKGLVIREQGEDRRFVYFSLSKHAKEKYQAYSFELNKRATAAFSSWPEEEKQLLYVLLGRLSRSFMKHLV